jgi:hypothetical protein
MSEANFKLALNERDEVVLIDGDGRTVLGKKDQVCAEMCRFLVEVDYGNCA